jgi:regulatory protein
MVLDCEGSLARGKGAAIHLLSRREHSQKELRGKLSKRFSSKVVDEVLQELLGTGLLSDRRFAETLIRVRFSRGYGPLYISQELSAKGVDKELAQECLSVYKDRWLISAKDVVNRKKSGPSTQLDIEGGGNRDSDSFTLNAKHARFLCQRGFSAEIIYQVL